MAHVLYNLSRNPYGNPSQLATTIIVSEWVLLSANSAIFQLYHGENKLIFNEMMISSALFLDQHTELDFYSDSSLKQKSVDRYVAPLGHIIVIPSQPVFDLAS